MKRRLNQIARSACPFGRAALFVLCAIAMVLAGAMAPASRPTLNKQLQTEARIPVVLRGRSRRIAGAMLNADEQLPAPRLTVQFHRSRQPSLSQLLFDASAAFPLVPAAFYGYWSPPYLRHSLPSAAHSVFAPPIAG